MTRPDYTHLVLLVDRSGSMAPIAEDMSGGIAAFLAEQAAAPGTATATLYEFDERFERVFDETPPGEAPTYVLLPRGSTALLDALGRSISETGELLAALPEDRRPSKVIFAVVTDGKENASREWTRDAVRGLIKEQTDKYGWEFAFLSADLDAVDEARDLGVPAASSAVFAKDSAGTRDTFSGLSASVTQSRAGGRLTVDGT